ncbi:hypothetical protein [Fusobacterium sp.]|uniref:hypothetical protein n=1 Tax=Fusobacterium sp. TaxID=68766 RepID=UPI0026050BD8|nr:hypothetical protein [Fusobacterium sp.]
MKVTIYYFIIILYIFISNLSYSVIYNNKKIITQTFITYEKKSGQKISAVSNYVSVNLKEIVGFEVNNFLPKVNLEYEEEVELPYKITNEGNFTEGYIIDVKNYEIFSQFSIFLDSNQNGIIDKSEENLIVEKVGNNLFELQPIETNKSTSFILKGRLKNKLEINEFNLQLKISSLSQREIFKNINNQINVYSKKNINIRKGIYYNKDENKYYFTFKFLNESSNIVEEVYLEDDININFKFNNYFGYWQDFETLKKEEVTFFKDGFEEKAPLLDISLVNNKLRVTLKNLPIQSKNDVGGILYIPFYVDSSTAHDDKLTNIAKYDYTLNGKKTPKYNTNEVMFFNKYTPKLEVTDDSNPDELHTEDKYIYRFENEVKNIGNGSDTFNILIKNSNFPSDIKFLDLIDSNNDGIVDTGPLKQGESKKIIFDVTFTKEELEHKNYSLNLLFSSAKVKEYKISNTNSLNLDILSDDILFIKEQRLRSGSYSTETLKVATGDKIYYKITLRNKSSTKTIIFDKVYDYIPETTLLSEGNGSLEEGGIPIYKNGSGEIKKVNIKENNKLLEIENIEIQPMTELIIYFNVDVI